MKCHLRVGVCLLLTLCAIFHTTPAVADEVSSDWENSRLGNSDTYNILDGTGVAIDEAGFPAIVYYNNGNLVRQRSYLNGSGVLTWTTSTVDTLAFVIILDVDIAFDEDDLMGIVVVARLLIPRPESSSSFGNVVLYYKETSRDVFSDLEPVYAYGLTETAGYSLTLMQASSSTKMTILSSPLRTIVEICWLKTRSYLTAGIILMPCMPFAMEMWKNRGTCSLSQPNLPLAIQSYARRRSSTPTLT
ncbi:MAG: hypothetical protein HC888_11030 [Candidatus Competibacteraceae bacterium]|nr:hypothetical protein [Candidatus Competibacteraceae bacterium]